VQSYQLLIEIVALEGMFCTYGVMCLFHYTVSLWFIIPFPVLMCACGHLFLSLGRSHTHDISLNPLAPNWRETDSSSCWLILPIKKDMIALDPCKIAHSTADLSFPVRCFPSPLYAS
jgi:hypothetical protein